MSKKVVHIQQIPYTLFHLRYNGNTRKRTFYFQENINSNLITTTTKLVFASNVIWAVCQYSVDKKGSPFVE